MHRSPTGPSISRRFSCVLGRNLRDVSACTIIPHGSQSLIPFWGIFCSFWSSSVFLYLDEVPYTKFTVSNVVTKHDFVFPFFIACPIDHVAACATRIGRPNRCTQYHTVHSRGEPQTPLYFILRARESAAITECTLGPVARYGPAL